MKRLLKFCLCLMTLTAIFSGCGTADKDSKQADTEETVGEAALTSNENSSVKPDTKN